MVSVLSLCPECFAWVPGCYVVLMMAVGKGTNMCVWRPAGLPSVFAAETDMRCSVRSTETACAVPARIMDGWERPFPSVQAKTLTLTVGHTSALRKQTNGSAHFLPLIQSGALIHGMTPPTYRKDLLSVESLSEACSEPCFHGDSKSHLIDNQDPLSWS